MVRLAAVNKTNTYQIPSTQEEIKYQAVPNQIRPQNIYIVDEKSKEPEWDPYGQYAVTVQPADPSIPYLTRIVPSKLPTEDPLFNSPEAIVAMSIAIEVCNGTFEVRSDTAENAPIMQEIYCNSLGRAMAMKKNGLDYEQWQVYQQLVGLTSPTGESFGLINFTPEEYSQFPE